MKYAVLQTTRYKNELKKALKRGHDIMTLTLTRTGSHSDLF